jgi:hypothetical protein
MTQYRSPIEWAFDRKDQLTLDEFNHLLAGFDWYFKYSDDHRVWERGHRASGLLKAIAQHRGAMFETLMAAWSKHHFTGNPWGDPKAPKPPMEDIEVWVKLIQQPNT